MSERQSLDGKIIGAFLLVVLLIGGNFIAVKFSNIELAPLWGATLRFAVCTIVLFLMMSLQKLKLPRGMELRGALLYGLLSFGVLYAFLYWSLLHVSSGLASVLFATLPLMTLFVASMVGLEKLRPANTFGALMVIFGVALIFLQQLDVKMVFWPTLAVLAGVAAGAISTVIVKRLSRPNPVSINAVGMGAGTAFLLIGSLVAGEPIALPVLGSTWLALGYLVFSTVTAFILFVWIVNRWTASATSYALVLAPVVTIVLAALLLGEQISSNFLIGAAVVLGGVYIGALKPTAS